MESGTCRPRYYKGTKGKGNVIGNDDYDFVRLRSHLARKEIKKIYQRRLKELLRFLNIKKNKGDLKKRQQKDPWSKLGSYPIKLYNLTYALENQRAHQ
jgi:hypothetical protein